MKTVRIVDGAVAEIIPDEATTPSVAYWYGNAFSEQCITAPDDVEQRWTYDPTTKAFSAPEEAKEPEAAPTEMEKMRADIDYLAAMGGVTL